MGRKKVEGECAICRRYGPLSYEHIPPKAAFNDGNFWIIPFDKALELDYGEEPKARLLQGGIGIHSICDRCNNNTGSWYARAYVEWCYMGITALNKTNYCPGTIYYPSLFPLRILKQIVSMFISINHEGPFRTAFPDLNKFVHQKEEKYLDSRYRVYAYYNHEGSGRFFPMTWIGGFGSTKKIVGMTELAYPPFGFVLTIDSDSPDERLFEISFFARYDYAETADLRLDMPVLPVFSLIPADYRSEQEIIGSFRRSTN